MCEGSAESKNAPLFCPFKREIGGKDFAWCEFMRLTSFDNCGNYSRTTNHGRDFGTLQRRDRSRENSRSTLVFCLWLVSPDKHHSGYKEAQRRWKRVQPRRTVNYRTPWANLRFSLDASENSRGTLKLLLGGGSDI